MRQSNPRNLLAVSSHSSFIEVDLSNAKYWSMNDVKYMNRAIDRASEGALLGEVPVGAVLVCDNKVIGESFNQPILTCDPTAHAEIMALRSACAASNNYRLPVNSTLYVTLEPCTMCIGALIHARLTRLIYATNEPRAGMVGSQMNLTEMNFYNHKIDVQNGLMQKTCEQQLKVFFKTRRAHKKETANH